MLRQAGLVNGVAAGDFDGDGRVDLVVSHTGAQTKLDRNVRRRPGLRVGLAGSGANGNGIGAVVRSGRQGQWGPAREVHGGGGCGSQDSAVQVMATPEPPSAVWVRWPGGKTTLTPVPKGARTLTVHYY